MPKTMPADQKIAEMIGELKGRFARWSEIKNNGAKDPFWTDGVNINIVRNHILYYRKEIEQLSVGLLFPPDDPILNEPVPPEMPNEWMAKPRHMAVQHF